MKMLGRVFVFGIIATTDVTAGFAQSQMNPAVAHFQTLLATIGRLRLDLFYFLDV
jgi:enamine deaminase RidA (YjgF/YER057c/UK114 family)